jgi:hypothetical protein
VYIIEHNVKVKLSDEMSRISSRPMMSRSMIVVGPGQHDPASSRIAIRGTACVDGSKNAFQCFDGDEGDDDGEDDADDDEDDDEEIDKDGGDDDDDDDGDNGSCRLKGGGCTYDEFTVFAAHHSSQPLWERLSTTELLSKIGEHLGKQETCCLLALGESNEVHPAQALTKDNPRLLITRTSPMLRMASRIGFVFASPLCLRVLHNYEKSHRSSQVHGSDFDTVQVNGTCARKMVFLADTIQVTLGRPTWFAQTEPLQLLVAALSIGYLFISYSKLSGEDKLQPWIVGGSFLSSIVASLFAGYSVFTIGLTIVPWTLFFSLIASDALHLGARLRAQRLPQDNFDEEEQRACMPETKNCRE